jgi:hypothetical protein
VKPWTRHLARWAPAVVWGSLALLAGPAFAAALDPRSRPVQVVASVGLWAIWALVLVGTLVPRTVSLTLLRIACPAALAAAGWAALATPEPGWRDALALGATALATVVALAPGTGAAFVNGSSYGAEVRLPLRPPGPLLLGPIEAAWLAVVAGVVTGPLLLAAGQWAAGGIALVVGLPVAALGTRSLHGLARRWVVFVPAGMVIVDPATLTDSLLVQRRVIANLGPAPADTTARDLTAGALGLALQLDLTEPQTLVPRPTSRGGSVAFEDVGAVLFTPTRPGRVLAEARAQRLPVGVRS